MATLKSHVTLLVTTLLWWNLVSAKLEVDKVVSSDLRFIKKELPDFQRADFKQIPYLIQRVNIEAELTEYLLPPEIPGQIEAKIAFTRKFIDTHLSLIVFQTGDYNFGKMVPRKYVVLRRHSKKAPVYFLAYAYVRRSGIEKKIEWEIEELSRGEKLSRMETEICRGDDCDLPEWILGTCTIVSHKCRISLEKGENETIFRHWQTEQEDEEDLNNFHGSDSDSTEESEERRRKKRNVGPAYLSHAPQGHKTDVPSSLDLLFVHRDSEQNVATDERQHSRRRRQKSPGTAQGQGHNIEEILHILKCRDCQKTGSFFEDLEEDVSLNKVLGGKFKTQFENETIKHWRRFPWMHRSSSAPYVGYGDCAFMNLEPDLKKPISKEMDDVIEFYLNSLRLECNNILKNEVRGWLTSKWRFIRIVQDLSFELIPNSKLLTFSMLTPKEFETVTSALLFLKYSTVYREESSNAGSFRLELLGHPLSTRVSFLTRVFLKIIDEVNRHLTHHVIKISRGLARNLKDKFYALLLAKNFIHLKKTSKQGHLFKENYRDRIQIMALKEFILYGLNPIFRSGTPTDVAFQSFYQLNKNRIRFLVHSYGFDSTDKLN